MSDSCLVTMHGPAGVVAAVPSLLGFHPRDSLVVVGLSRTPRRTLTRALRLDWSPADPTLPGLLGACLTAWDDDVIVVLYGDADPARPDGGADDSLDALVRQLIAAGVRVLDVLSVAGDRIRSNPPGSGLERTVAPADPDDPDVVALRAALAIQGRTVLGSREALARSIAGPATGTERRRAGRAFRAAADGILRLLESTPRDPDPLVARTRRVAERALADTVDRGRVSPDDAAGLAVLAGDLTVRDQLIAWAMGEDHAQWTAMLARAVGQVVDRQAVPLLAVLAMAAYRGGDGALANVSVERIFTVDPDHRLAHLLSMAMQAGITPDRLGELAHPLADVSPASGG